MNDNIDKNEIRKAIDRLQAEHPCGIAYDPAAFVNMEAVNTIKKCVDKIARRMMEDTEINIICEFAKLYLEGARPEIKPRGEWIFEKGDGKTRCDGWGCSFCGRVFHTKVPYFEEFLFCPNCGARMEAGDPK